VKVLNKIQPEMKSLGIFILVFN